MAKSTQFARIESYSATSKTTISQVLDEASRNPDACPHVERPLPPDWLVGSRDLVEKAVAAHMSVKAEVRVGNKVLLRKRRDDHRSLCAGVMSHPLPMLDLMWTRGADQVENAMAKLASKRRRDAIERWRDDSIAWLRKLYGDKLVAVVQHSDESHPHLHFFVVGDAQRLHPGLKAELVDGVRSDDAKWRREAHTAGLSAWLDAYHSDVGQHHGLERGDGSSRPIWRIKDRTVRANLHKLQQSISEIIDEQQRDAQQEQWNEMYDSSEMTSRPSMRF